MVEHCIFQTEFSERPALEIRESDDLAILLQPSILPNTQTSWAARVTEGVRPMLSMSSNKFRLAFLLVLLEVVFGFASGRPKVKRSPTIPMLEQSNDTSLSSIAG